MAQLDRGGAFYRKIEDFGSSRGCGIRDAVEVRSFHSGFNRPFKSTCTLAAMLFAYEQQVLQPAAIRILGQPVAEIMHAGSYSCRTRNNRPGRLSEHAYGRAIDIWAFDLADGTRISIQRDWSGSGQRSAFLREVSRAACRYFSIVLSPESGGAHRDHLHFDTGPWPLCEA